MAELQKRALALFLMVFIIGSSLPITAFAALSVDLKVNGSDSNVTLNSGDTYTYTWSSADATACQLTSPAASGITLSGSSTSIGSGHPFYPTTSSPVTLTVTCTDGTSNSSDSIVVSLASGPSGGAPTVDVKANGSDGPVTLNVGDTYTYAWTSTNATACQLTSPAASGITLSGTSTTIGSGHPFYPAAGSSVTITITCTDGTVNATDAVVINLAGGPSGSPTVDVKANGSDGPVTLAPGATYTYTWTSANATACQLTSPAASGITLTGSSIAIGSGHPFYPAAGSSVTITIVCTNGTVNATDSVVINLGGGVGGAPTVDVDANGSDGPVTISSGSSYTYSWTSANATACQMTSPVASGVSLTGSSTPITSGVASFYPSVGSPVTITITCTNGTANATDSVVINMSSGGGGGAPTVDVKANGSDGPVTINNGDSYTYTWTSANATACQMTSPVASGVSLTGSSTPITSSVAPFYPTQGSPVTITVVCTNGTANATDSVVIQLATPGNSGGGGGGGGGSSRSQGAVLAGSTECPWIHDYMRIDFQNDPVEVMKLQAFLKVFMGYDYVTVNGVFDQATYTAVGAFQARYASEILTPWGHTAPTHYVYILTLKKINELYCQDILPLTLEQQNEIITFRNLIQSQPAYKGVPDLPASGVGPGEEGTVASTTIVGLTQDEDNDKGQKMDGLAAALFTFPNNVKDIGLCFMEFILVLAVLYILGTVLKDVLYSELPENVLKRFLAKWITITLGLLLALFASVLIQELCLVLPLLVALIFSTIWLAFYPKHDAIKTTAKSWIVWKKEEKTVA